MCAFIKFLYQIILQLLYMGLNRLKRGGKNSQFIPKLLQILSDQLNQQIIKFDRRKRYLIVYNKKRLEQILPNYFKHSNFESFTRQLNWFGFSKSRGGNHHIFRHQELKKGKKIQELKSKRKSLKLPEKREKHQQKSEQIELIENERQNNRNEYNVPLGQSFTACSDNQNFLLIYYPAYMLNQMIPLNLSYTPSFNLMDLNN